VVELEIVDLTPRFLDFYVAAREQRAGPELRWQLWQERYGFAAVPPTPDGRELARRLLEEAWDRYPEVIDRIRAGAAGLQPAPLPVLQRVIALLRCPAVAVRLVVFVGFLEGNAFGYGHEGRPTVCIPVEQDPTARELTLPHEFTHAVHLVTAGLSGGWERPVAQIVMEEGLATRVTEALVPGREPAEYVEFSPGWLARCGERREAILRGIREHLGDHSAEAVHRFTVGTGTTGLEREAYYAGWLVVGHWLDQGRTLAELAHVPPERMVPEVEDALVGLLRDTA